MNLFKKKVNNNKPKEYTIPEDQYMMYNGVRVHWFIGDFNFDYKYWHCWGSCIDISGKVRAYQMHGKWKGYPPVAGVKWPAEKHIENITVLHDPKNFYHHEESYNRLTK